MNGKASVSKELNAKHMKILGALFRLQDNSVCAGCRNKGPRRAGINLGIFICMQCAGIHRSLGVHISKLQVQWRKKIFVGSQKTRSSWTLALKKTGTSLHQPSQRNPRKKLKMVSQTLLTSPVWYFQFPSNYYMQCLLNNSPFSRLLHQILAVGLNLLLAISIKPPPNSFHLTAQNSGRISYQVPQAISQQMGRIRPIHYGAAAANQNFRLYAAAPIHGRSTTEQLGLSQL